MLVPCTCCVYFKIVSCSFETNKRHYFEEVPTEPITTSNGAAAKSVVDGTGLKAPIATYANAPIATIIQVNIINELQ